MGPRTVGLSGKTGLHLLGQSRCTPSGMRYRLLALFAALLPCYALAQANTWIDFPSGLNHNLVAEPDGTLTARVPVNFAATASVPAGGLKTRVFDVVFKEGRSEQLSSQFAIELVKPTATSALALVVRVAHPEKVLPGAYVVSVQVDADFDATNSKPQTVTLSLQRYAPQLAAPSSIVLGQVRSWFWSDTNTSASFRLTEQSTRAAAAGLTFAEDRDSVGTTHPDTGKIVVTMNPASVPAGGTTPVDVSASNEFPLGSTKGKILIRSPDLVTPISVGYEVRVRRELWIIALCAGIGALLGWLVRGWIAPKKALLAARVVASEAAELIRKELASSEDETYGKSLKEYRDKLDDAVNSRDPAKLTEEAKKVTEGITVARSKLQDRLLEWAKKVEEVQCVIDLSWILPDEAQQTLTLARQALSGAQERLTKHDADATKNILTRLTSTGLVELYNKTGSEGAGLAEFLVGLVTSVPPLPDEIIIQIKQVADAATAQLLSPFTPVKTVTVDEMRAMLQRVDGQFCRATTQVADQLTALTSAFVSDAWKKLELQTADHEAQLANLRDAAIAQASAIASDIRKPIAGLLALKGNSSYLKALWRNGLVSIGEWDDKMKGELDQAIKDGRWSEAIEIAKSAIVTPPKSFSASGRQKGTLVGESKVSLPLGPTRSLSSAGSRAPSVLLSPMAGTTRERQEILHLGNLISWVQSVIFFVLFVVGIFLLYADSWVGTGKEMLTLVVLGFGVDLTGDSVLALFKKLKLPEV